MDEGKETEEEIIKSFSILIKKECWLSIKAALFCHGICYILYPILYTEPPREARFFFFYIGSIKFNYLG